MPSASSSVGGFSEDGLTMTKEEFLPVGAMTKEEFRKLHETLHQKYVSMIGFGYRGHSRKAGEDEWASLLESLGIEKMSKLMHLCVPAEDGEVRLMDVKPWSDDVLRIPRETAFRILVLGVP